MKLRGLISGTVPLVNWPPACQFAVCNAMKKSHPTIIVIDDSEDDQFLIKYTFKKIGVTDPIHLLSDGTEAIAYMMGEGKFADRTKFRYPTFIMTDLKMPRTDGFGVLEFLKSNPEWAGSHPDDRILLVDGFGRHQKGLYARCQLLSR